MYGNFSHATVDVYLYIRDRCQTNKKKTKAKRNFNSPDSICYT